MNTKPSSPSSIELLISYGEWLSATIIKLMFFFAIIEEINRKREKNGGDTPKRGAL